MCQKMKISSCVEWCHINVPIYKGSGRKY